MDYNILGKTEMKVSKLCFGALTIGPLQANLPIKDGARVIEEALDRGVNFIDTAELYKTYGHIKEALKSKNSKDIIIATKSYSYSRRTAEESLKKALKELGRDYIDIFLLHEQENEYTLKGHYEALEYFIKMKEKGFIRAVGISTHTVAAVKAAAKMEEIEIIHPLINKNGLGIMDGTVDDMIKAIKTAKENNKGIYGMKPLGGGNLLNSIDDCFDFVLNLPFLDSIAVGMQRLEEVIANVNRFDGKSIPKDILKKLSKKNRKLHIDFWCKRCGKCVEACKSKALSIQNDKLVVDTEKCVLCGYCSSYCPEFCIKVV
ncbi:aldo/keto reductase [Paramaledivibacter caminithermalis]|uniref:Predicted oxidoreductase n=1 Tax=Paramaledivibacter caminithermalis (strain DSM 15212 / CIP 107654 / DViRD3) TaxID=1121301 RepID=A0A1M6JT52_PARC5|nr:aldo/keto reductase [Paramaledivibacter caminithermalis]SHJ49802.1 Predicted oxidoreductase [Paramaledivibacter caminithermalis DSM 15212]